MTENQISKHIIMDNKYKANPTPRSPRGEAHPTCDMHYGAHPSTFRNAGYLRNNETPTEKLLWQKIRNNQLGVKIRRQHPIGDYIADFYCHKAKLIIELDGKYHESQSQRKMDNIKDEILKEFGLRILHFSDEEVINDIASVISQIKMELSAGSPSGD